MRRGPQVCCSVAMKVNRTCHGPAEIDADDRCCRLPGSFVTNFKFTVFLRILFRQHRPRSRNLVLSIMFATSQPQAVPRASDKTMRTSNLARRAQTVLSSQIDDVYKCECAEFKKQHAYRYYT